MANITKQKRDQMLSFLEQLKKEHSDDESIRAFNEIENHLKDKKFGLVFEEHTEEMDVLLKNNIPILCEDKEKVITKDKTCPWNFLIEGDNLQALYLLEKTHLGKVDCIYIDPPYNTGAKDWKYNNDYVDALDAYRHSKWLSMMKSRLLIAKRLLNPHDSVLICTIDEKEYLHIGCLLEEMFPEANIQMISSIIAQKGVARGGSFYRTNEFIYIVQQGDSKVTPLELGGQWSLGNKDSAADKGIVWSQLRRSGTNDLRGDRPKLFYPLFFNKEGTRIIGAGEWLERDQHPKSALEVYEDKCVLWPIKESGIEGNWQISQSEVMDRVSKGYVKVGKRKDNTIPVAYLKKGSIQKIEKGEVKLLGYDEKNGAVVVDSTNYSRSFIPGSQWNIESHDATYHGSQLLNKIFGEKRFDFPKSLYAVHDVLKFFLYTKKNATVVDYFAGSGSTAHAVNLLNAEDGGHRKWIMITNNEVSAIEEKEFLNSGVEKGSDEWENKGVAKFITWPRIKCSIEGLDINGNPMDGNYGCESETFVEANGEFIDSETGKKVRGTLYKKAKVSIYPELAEIKMSDGFVCNVKYFKCGWTPRKPEDYLLSNALCLHIKEMIELQNAIDVDGEKNVLLLNKEDVRRAILNPEQYKKVERIWLNQCIILNSEELKLLNNKGYTFIPREYFGQELREAAE